MTENPFACPACDGEGTMECPCCAQETDCEECDGTGLDGEKIDVKAFRAAEENLFNETKSTWAWVEGGVVKGRRNSKRCIAYEDYRRKA